MGGGLPALSRNTRFADLKAPFQPDHEISLFRLATPFSTSSSCWAVPTHVLALVLRGCPARGGCSSQGSPCSVSTFPGHRDTCLSCVISECPTTTPVKWARCSSHLLKGKLRLREGKVTCQGHVTKDHRAGACALVSVLQKSMFYT